MNDQPKFRFDLGAKVKMRLTDETGEVWARAQYRDEPNMYLLVYKAADGCQKESWWNEHYIEPAK